MKTKGNKLEIETMDLSDEVLAFAELEKDPAFRKIGSDKYAYYVSRSLEMGEEAAAKLQGQPIRKLLEAEGVHFDIVEAAANSFKVALRAQLDWTGRNPRVTVYQTSMNQLLHSVHEFPEVFGLLTLDDIVDIHLAHEFYHLLEYRSGRFTNEQLDLVEIMKLGPFRRQATVVQTSEIAAHAFCKGILNLTYLPSLLDWIYLLQTESLELNHFRENVNNWRSVLGESTIRMV